MSTKPATQRVTFTRTTAVPPPFDERVRDGYYHTALPYPDRRDVNRAGLLDAYRADERRLNALFMTDLFDENGVTDNPKRQACYAMAWVSAHSGGLAEVANVFAELVTLIEQPTVTVRYFVKIGGRYLRDDDIDVIMIDMVADRPRTTAYQSRAWRSVVRQHAVDMRGWVTRERRKAGKPTRRVRIVRIRTTK